MPPNIFQTIHSSFETKKNLPGTLNIFQTLWMITELTQIKIFAQRVLKPGGTVIIFSKRGQNQISTPLWGSRNLLSLSSVVEIFLGCTILKIWIFCLHLNPRIYLLLYSKYKESRGDKKTYLQNGASNKNFDHRT